MLISDTLTQFGGNFARPTKYNILLSTPSTLNQDNKIFDILGKSVSIPPINNTPIEFKIKGQNVKLPGRTQQEQTITIVFYVDEGLKLRNLFQDWIYALDNRNVVPRNINSQSIVQGNISDKYGNLTVIATSFDEKEQMSLYMFENIFPISVGELNYSGADKDAILELTVTFAYYRFITKGDFEENIEGLDNFLNSFGILPNISNSLGNFSIGSNFGSSFNFGGLNIFKNALNGISRGITAIGNISNLVSSFTSIF